MPPIGETLREARLRQGVDIAEVEQATKIRAKYLRALEAEEFDRLPGSTFVRTFLRTYAEYLGLDPQLLVEEYRATHESPAYEEVQPFTPPASTRPRGREGRRRGQGGGGRPGRGTMIAAAVVGILALLLVIGLVGGDGGEEEGDGRPASAGAEGTQRREEKGRGEPSGREKPDVVSLHVEPAAETYLCIETGEGEELVNANVTSPETFEGKTLRVLLGNTLAVELTANGEPVELEESPDPVGREITPEGDEELSTGELPCQ
ncbi:MAG: helix-turn-helix domain-containing protein [Thermoleophilaceae bacterium]